jgi:RNA 2',3'-cyclic 3'-phosphodiesterase
MRMFIAIAPMAAERDALAQLQHRLALRLPGSGLRPVHPDDLHLTLRFLGDVQPSQLPVLRRRLAATVARNPRCRAPLASVAAWPPGAPRLLVAEFDGPPALHALADELEQAMREIGFAPERRPFRPHVTLHRCRPPADGAAVAAAIAALTLPALPLLVQRVVLFRSDPTGPLRYVPVAAAGLGSG